MKKLEKLKLHHLSQAEMEKRELNLLRGGAGYKCACGGGGCECRYYGAQENPNDSYYGGSSTSSNDSANVGKITTNNNRS